MIRGTIRGSSLKEVPKIYVKPEYEERKPEDTKIPVKKCSGFKSDVLK